MPFVQKSILGVDRSNQDVDSWQNAHFLYTLTPFPGTHTVAKVAGVGSVCVEGWIQVENARDVVCMRIFIDAGFHLLGIQQVSSLLSLLYVNDALEVSIPAQSGNVVYSLTVVARGCTMSYSSLPGRQATRLP